MAQFGHTAVKSKSIRKEVNLPIVPDASVPPSFSSVPRKQLEDVLVLLSEVLVQVTYLC